MSSQKDPVPSGVGNWSLRREEMGMKGDYPCFNATYTHDELVEHFLLTPAERAVVDTCYGEVNRHGVAVLLKAVQYVGYFPSDLSQVPAAVRTFLAHQLHLLWDHTPDYPWKSTTHDRHLLLIRQHTGFRFPTGQDKQALEAWLRTSGAPTAPTEDDLRECAYTRCRALGLELPAELELQRLARAALHGFFQDLYTPTVSPSSDSASVLSYQELPTSIEYGEAIPRRRKEERPAGIASRGMVRRWSHFSSCVLYRRVPDRDRGPDRCNSSGVSHGRLR
jgi:hypothetical protein